MYGKSSWRLSLSALILGQYFIPDFFLQIEVTEHKQWRKV